MESNFVMFSLKGEKTTLSVLNPLYIPADGVQEKEEDFDCNQFWVSCLFYFFNALSTLN